MMQKSWYALIEQTSESMYIQILMLRMSSGLAGAGLEEKILRINQRKEKYKRSTNNSHKKFICVARKLLYKLCTYRERENFEKEFESYQNSRVYYFIILSHVKIRMTVSQRENFKRNLMGLLNAKMQAYNEEIRRTNNKNFINFRFEEIADIQFALKALILYLDNKVEEAIEVIYKKEKGFVLKKQQFQMAISIVSELQQRLRSYPEGDLFPYFNDKNKKVQIEKEKPLYGGRSKKDEDEEWVDEKIHRQSSRHGVRKQKRRERLSHHKFITEGEKYPLLFLQNSYPINNHFFNVIFSYPDPQNLQNQPTQHPLNSNVKEFNPFQYSASNQLFGAQMQIQQENAFRPINQMKIKKQEIRVNPFYYPPLQNQTLYYNYDNKRQLIPPKLTGDTIQKVEEVMDYSSSN